MPQRHRGPLPIPTAELVELQGSLAPYSSTLWQGAGVRILVSRIASKEPDLVNDLETIIEHAAPSHVADADGAILLTTADVHTLPLDPLRRLMQERVDFDSRQAARMRQEIASTAGVRMFRATDDPKRRLRLAIRIAKEKVRELDDDDLVDAAEALGKQLETGLKDVHCIYLVASKDFVRMRVQDLVPELVAQWNEPARREKLAQEQLAAQMAAEEERKAAKAALDGELRSRFQGVARAPVRSLADTRPPRSDARPIAEASSTVTAGRSMDDVRRRVDALDDRLHEATSTVERIRGAAPDPKAAMAKRLKELGFAVRVSPPVKGHRIDIAAERAGRSRIVVRCTPRPTKDDLTAFRKSAQMLRADRAFLVSDKIDEPMERHLGRIEWIAAADVAGLDL